MSLQLLNLSKRYGANTVFDDISLEVAEGEFVAILGDSGVGKSSLLNCIAGLDDWTSGQVLHGATDLGPLNENERALWRRQHLGFVFQAFHVLPHLSVAHNIALPLLLLGQPDAARVQEMTEAVGLGGLQDRLPAELSGGQLQRVAIARALVHRPRLVLADEPTGNLDPDTAALVMQVLMHQCRLNSSAMVLVTHSGAAAALADRRLRLTAHGCTALE
jgi:putative ABC transport system ATP-binding protein